WARDPLPTLDGRELCRRRDAAKWKASYPARFGLYVSRSDLSDDNINPGAVLEMARHHCVMFVAYWEARYRVKYYPEGHPRHPPGGPKYDVAKVRGCILVCPPRHGKTASVGRACVGSEL